jgi:Ohr subfamily peroxiredoxin
MQTHPTTGCASRPWIPEGATSHEVKIVVGHRFYEAVVTRDWRALRTLLRDDATWTLPGESAVSGTFIGAEAIVEHVRRIAGYGVRFELLHVLVSRDHLALDLHNTGSRADASLDEHLATVLRLREGRIAEIETYLSDVPGMNAFFSLSNTTTTKETAMSATTSVLYQTSARATGGRDGNATTLDGAFNVKLATPRELGGPGGDGNNPEQLFAAGYAACFLNGLKLLARQASVPFSNDATVTSTVGVGPRADGGFALNIAMRVSIPGMPREQAEALVRQADAVCPYSHAVRGNVPVAFTVE